MYGLVNRAVKELVIERFGADIWDEIRSKAGVDDDIFIRMDAYPDDVTYRLVDAASKTLDISSAAILEAFGEYWVLYTGKEGYGDIMRLSGDTALDFLQNLNNLHARVGATFSDLRPPSFQCTEVTGSSLLLHYYSERQGLGPMVIGLVKGVGKLFQTPLRVETITCRPEEDHDTFRVTVDAS